MNRKDLRQIRDLVSTSQRQQIKGTRVPTAQVAERAKQELAAVSDAYETASVAVDILRSRLAYASADPDTKAAELATLIKALRDATSVLTAARAEARETVENLKSEENLTPPVPAEGDGNGG